MGDALSSRRAAVIPVMVATASDESCKPYEVAGSTGTRRDAHDHAALSAAVDASSVPIAEATSPGLVGSPFAEPALPTRDRGVARAPGGSLMNSKRIVPGNPGASSSLPNPTPGRNVAPQSHASRLVSRSEAREIVTRWGAEASLPSHVRDAALRFFG